MVTEKGLAIRIKPIVSLLISLVVIQCSWWTPSPKPDSKQLWQTIPVSPAGTISYILGEPVQQVLLDERGNPLQVVYMDITGHSVRKDYFSRPNLELLHQQIVSLPDSQLIWAVQSRLEDGKPVERHWYDARNNLLGMETNTYDHAGTLTGSQLRSPEDEPIRIAGRNPLDVSEWFVKGFNQQGEWRTYEVHSDEPFYQRYYLTSTGLINRTEVRTDDNQLIWYYTESGPVGEQVFVKIFSGTGQLLLQTRREKQMRAIFTRDSIPRYLSSIWSDGALFNLESVTLSDSTQLLVWRALDGNLLLRKRQLNHRTNIPVEDIFFYSAGPRHPMVWYMYDRDGHVRRITSYSPDGDIAWVLNFARNTSGRLIQSTLSSGRNELHETATYHYTLDGSLGFVERRGPFGKPRGSTQYFTDAPTELIRERDSRGTIVQDVSRLITGDTLRRATYDKLDFIWVGMYYDGKDRLTAQKRLTPDELSGQTIYFNPEGRRIAEEYLGKGGTVFQRIRYFENGSPLRIRENYSRDGALVNVDSVYMRPDGQELKIVSRDEFGKVRTSERFEYQNDSLKIKLRANAQNAIMTKTYFHYDSLGHLASTTMTDSAGLWLGETRFRYDIKGRMISEQMSGTDGEVLEDHRYHYDPQGRLHREQILQQEQLIETVEYEYLPHYLLRIAIHYSPDGGVMRREIEDIPAR